jgi:hypothetical protein
LSDKFAEQSLRLRALDGKRRIFSGAIGDFHFVRDQITIEVGEDFFFENIQKIEVKRVQRTENPNVGYHFPLLGQKRRILPGEWLQNPEIVGQHALKKRQAVRTGYLQQSAVRKVHQADV